MKIMNNNIKIQKGVVKLLILNNQNNIMRKMLIL